MARIDQETGVSEGTWKKALGGYKGCPQRDVYVAYSDWLQSEKPDSPNMEIVRRYLQQGAAPATNAAPRRTPTPTYTRTDEATYGPLLHFSNLTHSPVNEQGVVFLFGMVSKALGFESIEYVRTEFPDCAGKWRVDKGRLQHVRIEFEFQSRTYAHDHPIDGCEVIVCWEDNWKDCPLRVIELKSKIEELRNRPEFRALG